jgi:hypothetical protein
MLPTLAVTVIVVVPIWLGTGVTVNVLLAPEPPRTRLAFGTSVVLEELADTAPPPRFATMKPMVTGVFRRVVVFGMLEIVSSEPGATRSDTETV